MVQWVMRSNLHGGLIELFLTQASAVVCAICLWYGVYKRTLTATWFSSVLLSKMPHKHK